jgi:ankyrin repeat protein
LLLLVLQTYVRLWLEEYAYSQLTKCSGSMSDVRNNLNNVEAALIQLSISSNGDGETPEENLPVYREDKAELSHILDQDGDLLDLEPLIVAPDRVTPSLQRPSSNIEIIGGTSKSPGDTTEIGIGSSEGSIPATATSISTEATLCVNETDLSSSSHDIGVYRQEGIDLSPKPHGIPRGRDSSLPVSPEPGTLRGNSTLSSIQNNSPRTSTPALIHAVYRGDIEEVKLLVSADNDIEARHPRNGGTAAIVAALLGDSEILEILLNSGASVAATDRFCRTALHYAASEGTIDCVNLLLSHGALTTLSDMQKELPLHRAVRYNQETAKVLLAQQVNPLLPVASFKRNVLHQATIRENIGMIKLILNHIRTTKHRQDCSHKGCMASKLSLCDCPVIYSGIDDEDSAGSTAFQLAINKGACSVVSLLLPYSLSKVNAPQRIYDWTSKDVLNPVPWERPLHKAARTSDLELLRVLLAAGADVDLLNSSGRTALELAIHKTNKEATEILLEYGADFMINCTEHNNLPLLEEAMQVFSQAFLDVLLSVRPNLDFSTSTAARAVMKQAQIGGRWETVQKLVQQCAHQDQVGKILDEEETLFHALTSSTPEILGFLLQSGANVHIKFGYDYRTQQDFEDWRMPIHVVAGYGKTDMAVILLGNGAGILSKAGNGWLPLHQAIRFADVATIRYFLEQSINGIRQTGGSAREGDSRYIGIIKKAMKIASKRGSVGIVELVLERSKLRSTELAKEALRTAVQFGRRDVTEYLLRCCWFSPATLDAAQKAKFEVLQDEDGRPGNHLKDYEVCKTLVVNAKFSKIGKTS